MVGGDGSVTGIDMTAAIAGALLEAEYAARLERHGFERIETGSLVDTYARSKFEDTRRRAKKFGARGTTVKAYRPARAGPNVEGAPWPDRRWSSTWRPGSRTPSAS
jgi:hypothetical protein